VAHLNVIFCLKERLTIDGSGGTSLEVSSIPCGT